MSCEHNNFGVHTVVNRIEDVRPMMFAADVQIRCSDCGVRFRFKGLRAGLSPSSPTTDVAGFQLRAPIEPDAHLTSLYAMDPASRFPELPVSGASDA